MVYPSKMPKTVETRMLKNYNKDECLFALHSIDFMTLFSELSFDPNQIIAAFHEIFESLLNTSFQLSDLVLKFFKIFFSLRHMIFRTPYSNSASKF